MTRAVCKDPRALGMQSGKIPDSRIHASSEWWDRNWGPRYARLHGDKCWVAQPSDTNQWLQIDFKYKAIITEILTQGRTQFEQWVGSYTIAYSDDGVNFTTYKGDKGQDKAQFAFNHILRFSKPEFTAFSTSLIVPPEAVRRDNTIYLAFLGATSKVFSGNTDRNSVVRQEISPVLVARFIRIQPKTWEWHIAMRAEVHGCIE
ncbi:Hypothetical predicted protein, partial [Paramuricea clavata]